MEGHAQSGEVRASDATRLVEATSRLTAAVGALLACPVAEIEEPHASAVHTALRKAQDSLAVVSARVLARVEADGRWATDGTGRNARDLEDWLVKTSHGTRAAARRQARMARALEEDAVPGLGDALASGRLTLEHADVLTRLAPTTEARRAALSGSDQTTNAAHLLDAASRLGADELVNEVKRWAARVDPTADERGHREAADRVSCTLTRRDDGVSVSAFLTVAEGAALDTALTAVAGTPARTDVRTHAQRMGGALAEMARIVLDHGLAADRSGGFRPHLSVHVSYDTLVAQVNAVAGGGEVGDDGDRAGDGEGDGEVGHDGDGDDDAGPEAGDRRSDATPPVPAGFEPAVLADGTPIPAGVLARLACDAEVTRVVFGPASQVLDVGRSERLYTRSVRRAVIARDRHCRFPGCDRPPKLGEIHHVRHWAAHGGETSVANGILLCWHHHDVVHTRHLTIRRDVARGRWVFRERDGRPVADPRGPTPPEPAGLGPPPPSSLDDAA